MTTTTTSVGAWLNATDSESVHWAREIAPDGPEAVPALRRLLLDFEVLGVPSMLADAREALERANVINQQAGAKQNAAIQRVVQARRMAAAADDPIAALEALGAEQRESAPWLPPQSGEDSPLVAEARKLSRVSVQRAVMLAGAKGDLIYGKLQEFAAEAVAAVSSVPLPDKVWSTPDPSALVMRSEHPESWTTMLVQTDRFIRVHEAADLVRGLGGMQTDLPGSAPRLAWQYRAWLSAQQHFEQLRLVEKPLRLRWAVDHGWQPGLWRAEEINGNGDPRPAPRPNPLTVGRLKRAVGIA